MIELLAVFTITAIILLISVPYITNMIKQGDTNAEENFLNDVYIATEAYVQEEGIVITTDATYVTIDELLKSGYLKSDLINPNNNKKVKDEENKKIQIKVYKNEENILQFEMVESK